MIQKIQQNNNTSFKSNLLIDNGMRAFFGDKISNLVLGAKEANKFFKNDLEDDVYFIRPGQKKGYPLAPKIVLLEKKPIKLFNLFSLQIPTKKETDPLMELLPFIVNKKNQPIEYVKDKIIEIAKQLKIDK